MSFLDYRSIADQGIVAMRFFGTLRPETKPSPWRRIAIALVMLAHSAAFLSVAASILHIFYAGVTNRPSRWTKVALGVALGEGAVFAASRCQCPLRNLAEALGAESGQVTDIFLPRWLANRIQWVFTPMVVIGLGGLLRNRLAAGNHSSGRQRSEPAAPSAAPAKQGLP